jgi:serine protease Do
MVLGASDTHDVAALRGDGAVRNTAPLRLSADPPGPGETVILLGYPTVIRALLARTGDTFVQELSKRPHMDGEEAAVELARTN